MIFIVGQTEQVIEKSKLLQQVGQVILWINFSFIEKKTNEFEFNFSFFKSKNKILAEMNFKHLTIHPMDKMKSIYN